MCSFIWILNHDKLLTNFKTSAYGFSNANCKLRGNVVEHAIHVSIVHAFYGFNLQDWINLNSMHSPKEDREWCNYWTLGYHLIWTWRNKENHINNFQCPFNLIVYIEDRLYHYHNALIMNAIAMNHRKMVALVKWNSSEGRVYKA